MKTIAITGVNGFLGVRAVQHFNTSHKVWQISRRELDLTNGDSILNYLSELKPDFVLHSAAISDITESQQNPTLSNAVNKMAPYYIAKACNDCGAKLVYLSSDQVYSGNKERIALSEDAKVTPQNLYAEQKLEAERRIAEVLPSAVSLRLTWMYDKPNSELYQRLTLPAMLMEASKNHTKIRINTNQMRSVTYIKHVIKHLNSCFTLPGGVYNYGSENDLSILDFYTEATRLLGLDKNILEAFDGDERNILINTSKIKSHGIYFPSAIEGIQEVVRDYLV